jgi:hypothetical protein
LPTLFTLLPVAHSTGCFGFRAPWGMVCASYSA